MCAAISDASQPPSPGSADSSKTVTPEVTPVRQQGYSSIHKESMKDFEKSVEAAKTEETEGEDEIDGAPQKTTRSSSSPGPFEPVLQIIQDTAHRPRSMCSIDEGEGTLTGSGSEMSLATPRHRMIKERMMNSPRMSERPKVRVHVWLAMMSERPSACVVGYDERETQGEGACVVGHVSSCVCAVLLALKCVCAYNQSIN